MTSSTNVKALIEKNINKKGKHNDKIIPVILAAISAISILTTLGILITLLLETITFFTRIPITEFLFSTTWNPTGSDPKFGIWALIKNHSYCDYICSSSRAWCSNLFK